VARRSAGVIAMLTTVVLLAAVSASNAQRGVWALAGGKPQVRALLRVQSSGEARNRLDIAQYERYATQPIRSYDVDQTKLLHLILVRDDFSSFQHVHPALAKGHFTIDVALDAGHRYYVFSDSKPSNHPQQVFRYTLQSGEPPHHVDTTVWAHATQTLAGPYHVSVSTVHLRAGRNANVKVNVTKNGRVATDLHPYLGAAAHAVFINTASLSYVHVHPMTAGQFEQMEDTSGMHGMSMEHTGLAPNEKVTGRMYLMVPALKPGLYKLWLQFQGGSQLYVAPFTIAAQ
jgi:hypothetical protein